MRKTGMVLLITFITLTTLQGCGASDLKGIGNTSSQLQNTPGASIAVTIAESIENSKENTETTENAEAVNAEKNSGKYTEIELINGGRLFYRGSPNAELKIVSASGKTQPICSDMPSVPVVSPEGERVAYLSPYEWETLSDVHIFDIGSGKDEAILTQQNLKANSNVKNQTTPKKLLWLDDKYLLLVIQFAYGTVTRGGDLYVFDTEKNELMPLTMLNKSDQITDINMKNGNIYLDMIEFIDDNMTAYNSLERLIEIIKIYEAIRDKSLVNLNGV